MKKKIKYIIISSIVGGILAILFNVVGFGYFNPIWYLIYFITGWLLVTCSNLIALIIIEKGE